MDHTQAKHTTNLTKFFPFQNISLRQNLNKNYVDLIPSRVRRKPINKFCVQSQVKQNKRTNLKKGGVGKHENRCKRLKVIIKIT